MPCLDFTPCEVMCTALVLCCWNFWQDESPWIGQFSQSSLSMTTYTNLSSKQQVPTRLCKSSTWKFNDPPVTDDSRIANLLELIYLGVHHSSSNEFFHWKTCVLQWALLVFPLLCSTRKRAEQSLVRWATPQLHDIDALTKMVDPALKGIYPAKSLSRFADIIALCVQVTDIFPV